MATSHINLSFADEQGLGASVGAHCVALTAANFTATMALLDTLSTAVQAVSIGVLTKDSRIAVETKFNPSLPTDPNSQRGTKWLVRMRDTNGNAVTMSIPAADLSLKLPGSPNLSIESGAGLDLKNAIEAVVKSNDGEAVTVQEIVFVD